MVRRIGNTSASQETQKPRDSVKSGSNPLGRVITGSSKKSHNHLGKTYLSSTESSSASNQSQKPVAIKHKTVKHETIKKARFHVESKVNPPKSAEASIATESKSKESTTDRVEQGKEVLLLPEFTEEVALLAIDAMKKMGTKRNFDPEELKKLSNFKHIVIGCYQSNPEKRAMIQDELKSLNPYLIQKGADGEQPGYVMMSGSIVEMDRSSTREDDAVKFLLICLASGVTVEDTQLLKMVGTNDLLQNQLKTVVDETVSNTAPLNVTRDWLIKGLPSFREELKHSHYLTPTEFLKTHTADHRSCNALKKELNRSIDERLQRMGEAKEIGGECNKERIDTFIKDLHLAKLMKDTIEPQILSKATKNIMSQVSAENRREAK